MSDERRAAETRQGSGGELARTLERDRGYVYPEWAWAAAEDPDFMRAYNDLYRLALGEGTALPAKYRELVATAIIAYRGEADSVYLHLKRAIRLGATRREILEAFEAALLPGGALTFLRGLRALRRIELEGAAGADEPTTS